MAVPPSAAMKTPAASGGAGKAPSVKVEVEAPGMADTKKTGSGAGKLVTLLALLGGAGGAYYAYDQGLLPKSVLDSIPKDLLAMLPAPSVSSSLQAGDSAKAAPPPSPVKAAEKQGPAAKPAAAEPPKQAQKPAAAPVVPAADKAAPKTAPAAATAATAPASSGASAAPAAASAPTKSAAAAVNAAAAEAARLEAQREDRAVVSAKQLVKMLADDAEAAARAAATAAAAQKAAADRAAAEKAAAAADKAAAAEKPAAAAAAPAAAAPVAAEPSAAEKAAAEAKEEAQVRGMAAVHAVLKAQTDAAAGADLDILSASELRERVLRLSGELAMRGRWEAMRLIEALESHDKAWNAKVSGSDSRRYSDKQSNTETGAAVSWRGLTWLTPNMFTGRWCRSVT